MLKVWLPLTGDLHNQGVSGVTATGHSVTSVAAGKIGSCYQFTTSAIELDDNIFDNSVTEFTVAAWMKFNNSNSACLFSDRTAINQNGITCFIMDSGNIFYDVGTRWEFTPSTAIPRNQWFHIAFLYKKGSLRQVYLNGILVGSTTNAPAPTATSTDHSFIGASQTSSTALGGNYFNGWMNDVRIYDHCLSAAEVKEIAQGLILHYKLDQNITINQNIMPNSLDMPLGSTDASTGTWRLAGSNNMTRTRVAITDTPEGNGYGFQNSGIQTANDGSCYGINSFPMEANTNYIISMWARITEGTEGYAGFNVYSSTPIAGWQVINKNYYSTKLAADGSWTKCWMSFKTNSNTTRNIYIGITTGDTSVTTQMCNVHLEKGLLIDQNIIRDSSGYNYNGTILGTPTISNNTIRYSNCMNFPENTDGILSTFPVSLWNNAFTYSFWIKPSGENGGRSIYAASYNGTSCSIEKTTGNKLRFYWNGSPDLTTSSLTITDGVWQHIAIVKSEDKTKVYCYYNGELKDTFTNTFSDKTFSGNLRIARDTRGDATSYTGLMSDFRIYCTPLLDTDIKQLYNIGMKVDKGQNIHAFEFNETAGRTQFLKTGVIKSAQVADNLLFDNKAHIGKHSYENILPNNVNIVTTKNGHIANQNTLTAIPAEKMQSLAGKTLRFTYDVKADGTRSSAENNQTAWNYIRYGIHATFQYTNASGTTGTSYPFAGDLAYSGAAKRSTQTWTVPTGYQSYGALGFSIQTFDKPASTNNETWFIQNVRLEVVETTSNGFVTGNQIIER